MVCGELCEEFVIGESGMCVVRTSAVKWSGVWYLEEESACMVSMKSERD